MMNVRVRVTIMHEYANVMSTGHKKNVLHCPIHTTFEWFSVKFYYLCKYNVWMKLMLLLRSKRMKNQCRFIVYSYYSANRNLIS